MFLGSCAISGCVKLGKKILETKLKGVSADILFRVNLCDEHFQLVTEQVDGSFTSNLYPQFEPKAKM